MDQLEFFEKIKNHSLPVIVDVWAPWCLPCRVMQPVVEQLSRDYCGKVDVWKLNADEAPELVKFLRIYGIPTILVYKDGQELTRKVGSQSHSVLRGLFEVALTGKRPLKNGLELRDRILRILAGISLLVLAWVSGRSVLLIVLAGIVLFSAVYDRCPVWQAIAPRVMRLFRRTPDSLNSELR
jgi:thioredoxin 1